jgi:hypothetical protein
VRISVLTAIFLAACASPPLEGKLCGADPECGPDLVCTAGRCSRRGQIAFTPEDASAAAIDVGFAGLDASAPDAQPGADASSADAPGADAMQIDAAGPTDAASADAAALDATPSDRGFFDALSPDLGLADAALVDAGFPDAAAPDAQPYDAGLPPYCGSSLYCASTPVVGSTACTSPGSGNVIHCCSLGLIISNNQCTVPPACGSGLYCAVGPVGGGAPCFQTSSSQIIFCCPAGQTLSGNNCV